METDTITIELPVFLVTRLQAMAERNHTDLATLLNQLMEFFDTGETKREPTTAAFRQILARSVDLGVSDLAERHDLYLYGTASGHSFE